MFHENLKTIRIKRKKTQKGLADYLNISPQSVSKWEKGEALPSLEYLPKIAKFYDCDINSFFEERNTMDSVAVLKKLEYLEKHLKEVQRKEPDEEDDVEHEEWIQEVEKIEERIQEMKDKLELGSDGKWYVISEDLLKGPEQRELPREKYTEFFQLAKSVIVDNEDDTKLVSYLEENNVLKESITYICNLMMETNTASLSMIQHRMEIGYLKAGTIIEGLEEIGVASPFDRVNKGARKIIYEQLRKLKPYIDF